MLDKHLSKNQEQRNTEARYFVQAEEGFDSDGHARQGMVACSELGYDYEISFDESFPLPLLVLSHKVSITPHQSSHWHAD